MIVKILSTGSGGDCLPLQKRSAPPTPMNKVTARICTPQASSGGYGRIVITYATTALLYGIRLGTRQNDSKKYAKPEVNETRHTYYTAKFGKGQMWVEKRKDGKYNLIERYVDPITGRRRRA